MTAAAQSRASVTATRKTINDRGGLAMQKGAPAD
jgi:hypothetical protein